MKGAVDASFTLSVFCSESFQTLPMGLCITQRYSNIDGEVAI